MNCAECGKPRHDPVHYLHGGPSDIGPRHSWTDVAPVEYVSVPRSDLESIRAAIDRFSNCPNNNDYCDVCSDCFQSIGVDTLAIVVRALHKSR